MRTLAHTHTSAALGSCYTPELSGNELAFYFAHGWIHIHSLYQLPNTKVHMAVLPYSSILRIQDRSAELTSGPVKRERAGRRK
jgi:hypothetical protein